MTDKLKVHVEGKDANPMPKEIRELCVNKLIGLLRKRNVVVMKGKTLTVTFLNYQFFFISGFMTAAAFDWPEEWLIACYDGKMIPELQKHFDGK